MYIFSNVWHCCFLLFSLCICIYLVHTELYISIYIDRLNILKSMFSTLKILFNYYHLMNRFCESNVILGYF